MNFLAVDTSGNYMSVVVEKAGEVYTSFVTDCAMKHSVLLLPTIEATLQKAGLSVQDIDVFAAVVGAGSFTGIRIGISAMKGFALATGKKTLPITSFDVAAYNRVDSGAEKTLCLVDALHDCYYACGYEKGEAVLAPAYLTEAEVLKLIDDGYTPCACGALPLAEKVALRMVDPLIGLAKAARARIAQGKFGELNALYVRKSSAEENRQ